MEVDNDVFIWLPVGFLQFCCFGLARFGRQGHCLMCDVHSLMRFEKRTVWVFWKLITQATVMRSYCDICEMLRIVFGKI